MYKLLCMYYLLAFLTTFLTTFKVVSGSSLWRHFRFINFSVMLTNQNIADVAYYYYGISPTVEKFVKTTDKRKIRTCCYCSSLVSRKKNP